MAIPLYHPPSSWDLRWNADSQRESGRCARIDSQKKMGCRKMGCNKWALKPKGVSVLLSWKLADIGLSRPFSAFFALYRSARTARGKSRKWRTKAFFLRYPRICFSPHLLNVYLRHSKICFLICSSDSRESPQTWDLQFVVPRSAVLRKVLAPMKIKSALPPPKKPKSPPPPKTRNLMGMGFSCRKNAFLPGAHKIDAAISGPRIAGKFTGTKIFLRFAREELSLAHGNPESIRANRAI